MVIKIVKATLADSQEIRKLEEKVWWKGVTSPYDAATFAEYGLTFIARDNQKIVGAIIAIPTMKKEMRVLDWIVHHSYRRKGIGKSLYQRLFKSTKGRPILTYVDVKNTTSLNGHHKLEFTVLKKMNHPYGRKKDHPAFLLRRE